MLIGAIVRNYAHARFHPADPLNLGVHQVSAEHYLIARHPESFEQVSPRSLPRAIVRSKPHESNSQTGVSSILARPFYVAQYHFGSLLMKNDAIIKTMASPISILNIVQKLSLI